MKKGETCCRSSMGLRGMLCASICLLAIVQVPAPEPNQGPPNGPGPGDSANDFGLMPGKSNWDPVPSMSTVKIKNVGQYVGGKQVGCGDYIVFAICAYSVKFSDAMTVFNRHDTTVLI